MIAVESDDDSSRVIRSIDPRHQHRHRRLRKSSSTFLLVLIAVATMMMRLMNGNADGYTRSTVGSNERSNVKKIQSFRTPKTTVEPVKGAVHPPERNVRPIIIPNKRNQQQGQEQQPHSFSSDVPEGTSKCPYLRHLGRTSLKEEDSDSFAQRQQTALLNDEGRSQECTTSDISPLSFREAWFVSRLDGWYSRSQSLRCPFFRRRCGDFLDIVESLIRRLVIQPDHRPHLGPPQAFKPTRPNAPPKQIGISKHKLKEMLLNDWKATSNEQNNKNKNNNKGYYLTGRLSTAIYRDDCLFLGPDPDLPLRGLRKYMGVASHLFDYRTSTATLLSLEIVDDHERSTTNTNQHTGTNHLFFPRPAAAATTKQSPIPE